MSLPLADNALLIAGPVLEALIAATMFRRRLVREYPAFFVFAVFHVVRFVGLFAVLRWLGHTSQEYFLAYWSAQAISVGLSFVVIREIYNAMFNGHDAFHRLGAAVFRWAGGVLLLVAVVVAASSSAPEASRIRDVVVMLERSVRIM